MHQYDCVRVRASPRTRPHLDGIVDDALDADEGSVGHGYMGRERSVGRWRRRATREVVVRKRESEEAHKSLVRGRPCF